MAILRLERNTILLFLILFILGTATVPILAAANCENGGTPIQSSNACWCPPYFTGSTCGQWLCINGGKFDSTAKTCTCAGGYAGGHCEEVKCDKPTTVPDRGADKFTVVVYATNSMKNVITAAADGLKTVFDTLADKNYIKQYILTGYTGSSNVTTTVDKADDFENGLKNLQTQEVTACTENTNLFRGLDTSQRDVGHGKIVLVFLNSLPDDPNDAQFLAWQMENAHYQSQYFFVVTPPKTGCTLDKTGKGYKAIQNVAKQSGGLVIELAENQVKDFLTNIQTGQPSAFAPLAAPSQGVFFNAPNTATLLRADYDKCEDSTHMFYVDSTTTTILISATGSTVTMKLKKDGTTTDLPLDTYSIGNYFQYQYVTLATSMGRYELTVGGDKSKPCAFRLSALTDLHMSYSFTPSLVTDSSSQSALYQTAVHLAADFTDVTPTLNWAQMAELKVFNFNDLSKPVHTSNGQYRAQCTYELYFGPWTCDNLFDMYYFTVTFEDKSGHLAQRFGTTYCSDIAPTHSAPTGCQNGGVMSDGKCVCDDYWYGDHCTKIMCTSGGWPLRGDALCQCLPGFTGTHCENNICETKNPDVDFSFDDRSIAFVVQLTADMDHAIKYFADNVDAMVANLNAQKGDWITEYSLIGVDDKLDSPIVLKGSATTFINDVKELKPESGSAECQKELLGGVETALSVAKRSGFVFVLANSPSKDNVTEYDEIFDFLESTKAQVFFYLATPFSGNCDPHSDTRISNVADFSLGKVFMADMKQIPDFLLKFIPSLYQSGLVIEDMRADCETTQTFTFSLDSHSDSFTIAAGGNMPQLELMKPRDCPCGVTTTVSPGTTAVVPPNCQNVNIIFVVDVSQSVGKDHFELMKGFMVKITQKFTKIGSDGTEFAVVTFNRKGNIEFYLDTHQSIASLDQAIDGLIWKDGITNTADGLQKAIDVFQTHGRATAANVVVLISDGVHTDGFESPVDNAKILRGSQYQATIISVGIEGINGDENDINFQELIDISGREDLVINVTDWNELQNKVKDVVDKMPCSTPKPPNCDGDIAFVIETSEVMEEENFKKTQQSVIGLAKQFNIGKSNTRVALVHFSSPDERSGVLVNLDQTTTFSDFETAVNNLKYSDVVGKTDLDYGLKLTLDKVFVSSQERAENPNIVVLYARGLYDQTSQCCPDPATDAADLRKKATVFAVEIPIFSSPKELATITGSEANVFTFDTTSKLYGRIKAITDEGGQCGPTPPPGICYGDITFILETSEVMGKDKVEWAEKAINEIATKLNVGSAKTRVALVHFSSDDDRTDVLTNLPQTTTLQHFKDQVLGISWQEVVGISDLAAGLRVANDKVFTSANTRANSPNIAILFARGAYDHNDNCCPDPLPKAEQLRQKASIFAVEVNIDPDYNELVSITGSQSRVFTEANYMDMVPHLTDVIDTCKKATTPTTSPTAGPTATPRVPSDCQIMDVIFIVDSSQSVGKDNFGKLRDFMVAITKEFHISSSEGQFAVIQFNRKATVEFYFDSYGNLADLDNAINGLNWLDGITNTADAIRAASRLFESGSGVRKDVLKTVILLSDGVSTDGFDSPVPPAQDLRSKYNARIISVAVEGTNGEENEANYEQLEGISGSPNWVINVTGWSELPSKLPDVLDALPCAIEQPCSGDITFIIETSEIMAMEWVNNVKQAVIDLAMEMNVGQNKTHVSLVHFSDPRPAATSGILTNLGETTTVEQFSSDVRNMKYVDVVGITDISTGLSFGTDVYKGSAVRENSPNVAILFARGNYDHSSSCCPDPWDTATELRSYSTIFAVEVPVASNRANLERIVGGMSSRVFDWDHRMDVKESVMAAVNTCKHSTTTAPPRTTTTGPTQPSTTPMIPPKCQRQDLLFILDSSQSVGAAHFDTMKQFIIKITQEFTVSDEYAHFGLIVFNRDATPIFYFNNYSTRDEVDNAIENQQWLDGITNTAAALELAQTFYDPKSGHGVRDTSYKTVILVSDGISTDGFPDPTDPARVLRDGGATIISVGIAGTNGDETEANYEQLVEISGNATYVVNVTDWSLLLTEGFDDTIEVIPCDVKPGACFGDISFIIETSEKMDCEEFERVKDAVVNMTRNMEMTVGIDANRLSLIHFSSPDQTGVLTNLADTTTREQFINKTQHLDYVDVVGITDLALGLELANEKVFIDGQIRSDSPNIAIVFARGEYDQASWCCPDPTKQANLLNSKAIVYAVEVPIDPDRGELTTVAGGRSDRVFDLDNYDYMRILDEMKSVIDGCHASTTTPKPITTVTTTAVPQSTTTPEKPCMLDVIFILDASQSVGAANFKEMKKFMLDVVDYFPVVGKSGTQFGVISFNREAQIQFYLNSFKDRASVKNGIDGLQWLDGITNTKTAFEAAKTMFTPEKGARDDSTNTIIFLSDGVITCGFPSPVETAAELRGGQYGATILCLGVDGTNGRKTEASYTELVGISGDKRNVINVTDWVNIGDYYNELVTRLPCAEPCTGDLTFIIETSEVMGVDGVKKVKEAVKDLAEKLDIGKKETRVALVHFSSKEVSDVSAYFSDTTSYSGFRDIVDGLIYRDVVGISDLEWGLELANTKVIDGPGSRGSSKPIVVLFARGAHDAQLPDPREQSDKMRAKGALIYTVEQPYKPDPATLEYIAGSPSRTFDMTNYKQIADRVKNVIDSCKSTTTYSTTTAPPTITPMLPPSCQKIDFLFIVDASQSVGKTNFNKVKDFMVQITDQFTLGVGGNGGQFGVITYSRKAAPQFYFNSYSTRDDVKDAIKGLQWTDGITNTADALVAAKDMFTSDHGVRMSAANTVLLISDGVHTQGFDDPQVPARTLRDSYGVKIIALGIAGTNGDETEANYKELVNITGDPSGDLVISAKNFDHLDEKVVEVIHKLPCNISSTPAPSPCSAEIVFVLETSEVVDDVEFNKAKQQILDIASKFQLGSSENHVALVHFSSPDERSGVTAYLTDTTSFEAFRDKVNGLSFAAVAGKTDLYEGLRITKDKVLVSSQIREKSPQIVVVFARGAYDHTSSCCPDPRPVAIELRKEATILAVEIPVFADKSVLNDITGSASQVYDSQDYLDVVTKINKIMENTHCQTSPPPTTTHTTPKPLPCVGDIAFVVETSEVMGQQRVEDVKHAVVNLTSKFSDISAAGSHVALAHFSSKNYDVSGVLTKLSQTTSFADFESKVLGPDMDWTKVVGISDLKLGLELANDQIFVNGEMRESAPNTVVLIARGNWDHSDNCCESPFDEAAKLRSKANIYAVTVPIESSVANLATITGDRNKVYTLDDMGYMSIYDEIQKQIQATCHQSTTSAKPTVDPCQNHKIIVQDDQSLTIAQADADKSGAGTCQSSDACFAGVWQATVKTGSKSNCWIQVRAKGELQLFNGFTTSVASDYARDEPYQDTCIKNYGLGHMTGLVQPLGGLEYMNIYVMNNSVPSMVHSAKFTPRTGCAYDYRSEDFTCPGASFGMAYVGHDHCGYQFSRVKTAICMKFECLNGGHKVTSSDGTCACVCPKNFFGSDCGLPVCYNGGKMSNKKCVCSAGFNGDHCETVMCTSQSQITYGGKGTLVLVVDTTTDMQSVLDEFKATADDLMDSLKSDFSKFVVVPYHDGDSPLGTITSDTDSSKVAAALKALTVSADTDCPNPTMAALNAALDKAIPPAMAKTDMSMVFVITKSSAKDATMEDQVLAKVASSGVTVNFVIPGASDCIKTSDDIPSLYQQVSMASGGFVFPIGLGSPGGTNPLYNFLVSYIPESLGSQLVASESSSDCQDFVVYMPVDSYTNASLTITLSGMNAIAANVHIITPDSTHHPKPDLTFSSSDVNIMSVTIDPSKPPFDYGVYQFSISMPTSTTCRIQAKVKTDDRTFLGFISTDVHSDTAVDVPVYPGSANRLIAHVSGTHKGANFQFAKFYSSSMELLAVQDLQMRGGCSYGLLSSSFECHAKMFWVQISGHDDQGYVLERWTAAQCPSYPSSPTSTTAPPKTNTPSASTTEPGTTTTQPATTVTTTATTAPATTTTKPAPTCMNDSPPGTCNACQLVQDVVLLIDNSNSIKPNFDTVKNFFVNTFVGQFDIDAGCGADCGARFALATYTLQLVPIKQLKDAMNAQDFINSVIRLDTDPSGSIFIGNALSEVKDQLLQPADGERPAVPNVVILVADEASGDDAASAATELKNSGVTIVTLSLGPNAPDLTAIASDNAAFTQKDYSRLDTLNKEILDFLCNVS